VHFTIFEFSEIIKMKFYQIYCMPLAIHHWWSWIEYLEQRVLSSRFLSTYKYKFLNPGGSTKDRKEWKKVEYAERQGLLKPGVTII